MHNNINLYIISHYRDLAMSMEEIALVLAVDLETVRDVIERHEAELDALIIARSMEQDWANIGCEFDLRLG